MTGRSALVCLLLSAIAGLGAIAGVWPTADVAVAVATVATIDAGVYGVDAGYSNVARADYVGPDACGECHAKNHASWQKSLHATMNQRADAPGAVIGDFGGARLVYGGGEVRFEREGDAAVMAFGGRRFRVTRTIGTRYLQEYVGVEIGGAVGDATETRLPFGWWPRGGGWFPQPYFDSWYGAEYGANGALAVDPYVPDRTPWATRCAWCHNTYAFERRALRTLRDPPLGAGTEQYFDDHPPPASTPTEAAVRAAILADNRLPVDELVTIGISCESCHLGGREHARAGRDIHFAPTSDTLTRRADAPDLIGGRSNSILVVALCAQCHSTPTARFPDGSGRRNSAEALDLAAGACMARIKCTDCHDPHRAGPGAGAPDEPRHLAACTSAACHPHLAAPAAARTHGRHGARDASCLDCHMPKIVQGVSTYTRSHRISTPGNAAMIAADAPNACNLCHLERSLRWTASALAAGWGMRLAANVDDTPAGRAWLHSDDPGMRALAAAAYARLPAGRGRAALPALLAVLDDPIAYYRMRVLFAIEDVLGRGLARAEYDPLAPPAVRAAQLGRARMTWGR